MVTETVNGAAVTRLWGPFKTARAALLLCRPLSRDEAAANALLARVLGRGQAGCPTRQAGARRMEGLYGGSFSAGVVKKGERQLIQLCAETLDDPANLRDMLDFIHGAAYRPLIVGDGFDNEAVEAEKRRLAAAYAERRNDAREYAKQLCVEEMCAGEPFGIYGDGEPETVADMDGRLLYRHYERVMADSRAELIIMSRHAVPPPEIRGAGAAFAEEWRKPAAAARFVRREGGGGQAKLCVGLRANVEPTGELYYPLLVVNEIFGGGATSRLFAALRRKAGLCYYASSAVYRFKSIIIVEAGLEAKDAERAAELILAEAARVRRGDFTAGEVREARRGVAMRLRLTADEPGAAMDFAAAQRLAGDPDDTAAAALKAEAVTKRACQAAAAGIWADLALAVG